jgi:hypothetical protein
MFALVAGLAGYTVYEYKDSEDTAGTAKGEKRIFHLLRDDLEEITILSKGTETVLKRQEGQWQMTKPVEDLAEASAVEGFIYSTLTQKGREFREAGGKVGWAEYGLEPAGGKISIRGKGKTEAMEVSSKNAFDGSFFVRVGDEVWLGDRGLAQLLEREPASFRSRKIYRGPEQVNDVEVQLDYGGVRESFRVKRSGAEDLWTMDPDPGFAVDSAKVAEWVQKLTALHGSDFVPEMPASKPSMEVKLGGSTVTFSGDAGADVMVNVTGRPAVYKVGASSLDTVRVPKVYFRDGKAPFKFKLELVKEIEVHTGGVDNLFVKGETNWEIKRPVAGLSLDQDKLVEMIHAIQNLEAAEFVEGAKGLPPAPQIAFRGKGGETIFSLSWGSDYKPKYGFNKSSALRYARVSGLKESVGLPKDKLERLVDSAIIKK